MRQEGYYWVKRHGQWIIAVWLKDGYYGSYWYLTGTETMFKDSDFEEINENRIVYDTNTNR